MSLPVSRRTTLKAGGHAAWLVPAITIASAAPSYAASGDAALDVNVVTSTYAEDRPDILMVTLTIANTGTAPATGIGVSVLIPTGSYDSAPVVLDMPTFWSGLDTEGSALDGWVVRAAYSEPIEPQNYVAITVPIQFKDALNEPPYRTWAGLPIEASVVVTALNASTVTQPAPVLDSPPTRFDIPRDSGYHGQFQDNVVVLAGYAVNVGRKSTGDVVLRVWWNPTGDDPAWTSPPVDAYSTELGIGTVEGNGTSGDDPWYIVFPHGPTAPRDSFPNGAPPEDLTLSQVDFTASITLAATPVATPKDFYMTVRAPGALEPVPGVHGWQSVLVTPYVG